MTTTSEPAELDAEQWWFTPPQVVQIPSAQHPSPPAGAFGGYPTKADAQTAAAVDALWEVASQGGEVIPEVEAALEALKGRQ